MNSRKKRELCSRVEEFLERERERERERGNERDLFFASAALV